MKRIGILQFAVFLLFLSFCEFVFCQPSYTQISFTANGQRFDMMYVAGGEYDMGFVPQLPNASHGGIAVQPPDAPAQMAAKRVKVDEYYIGRYEVTQALWEAVMGSNPSVKKGKDLPVENVTFSEVRQFISRLNSITGVTFRLPTEAEWEFAARGGVMSKNNLFPGGRDLMRVGWSSLNSLDQTHPVGMLANNELGLYDMAGNVWELCSDLFDQDVSTKAGKKMSESHVCRGGSWADGIEQLTVVSRMGWPEDGKRNTIGFRLAISSNDKLMVHCVSRQRYLTLMNEGNKKYITDTAEYQGALPGVFSVGPERKVRFSAGNLRYNPSGNQWRFADEQYQYIGEDNLKTQSDYEGWQDLFGWGTSGYRDCPPYYFAAVPSVYGNGRNQNIDGTSYDWGVYNSISNGGNKPGLWRTLSVYEWNYLLMLRPNAIHLRALVTIKDVEGIMLLPDDWLERGLDTFDREKIYNLGLDRWSFLEMFGAVFLPSGGRCYMSNYHIGYEPSTPFASIEGIDVSIGYYKEGYVSRFSANKDLSKDDPPTASITWYHGFDDIDIAKTQLVTGSLISELFEKRLGFYWTSIHYDADNAMMLVFSIDGTAFIGPEERLTKGAVRLVKDVAEEK